MVNTVAALTNSVTPWWLHQGQVLLACVSVLPHITYPVVDACFTHIGFTLYSCIPYHVCTIDVPTFDKTILTKTFWEKCG